jgi:hypothetical protein
MRHGMGTNPAITTAKHAPRMIIDPLSQVMRAEHLRGEDELPLPLSANLAVREERNDLLRPFRRSSNTCGAIPLITSRDDGLKLAIAVAIDNDASVDFDKPGGVMVSIVAEEEFDSMDRARNTAAEFLSRVDQQGGCQHHVGVLLYSAYR